MKNINKLILAAVVAVAFTSINIANAGERLQSPRAKANETRIVPGTSATAAVVERPAGNAKMWALQQDFRKVPGSAIDLAHGSRPTMSPKDPRYEATLRNAHGIQVAPLK